MWLESCIPFQVLRHALINGSCGDGDGHKIGSYFRSTYMSLSYGHLLVNDRKQNIVNHILHLIIAKVIYLAISRKSIVHIIVKHSAGRFEYLTHF